MFTAAPAWNSAPSLVVYCVSYHEWIDLYNGSSQVVDLGGWVLDDEEENVSLGRSPSIASLHKSCEISPYPKSIQVDSG